MPLIKKRPSINEDWLRSSGISKEQLIADYPDACEVYMSDEYDRIVGKLQETEAKKAAKVKGE